MQMTNREHGSFLMSCRIIGVILLTFFLVYFSKQVDVTAGPRIGKSRHGRRASVEVSDFLVS